MHTVKFHHFSGGSIQNLGIPIRAYFRLVPGEADKSGFLHMIELGHREKLQQIDQRRNPQ